jgi:hypothetical protein
MCLNRSLVLTETKPNRLHIIRRGSLLAHFASAGGFRAA